MQLVTAYHHWVAVGRFTPIEPDGQSATHSADGYLGLGVAERMNVEDQVIVVEVANRTQILAEESLRLDIGQFGVTLDIDYHVVEVGVVRVDAIDVLPVATHIILEADHHYLLVLGGLAMQQGSIALIGIEGHIVIFEVEAELHSAADIHRLTEPWVGLPFTRISRWTGALVTLGSEA